MIVELIIFIISTVFVWLLYKHKRLQQSLDSKGVKYLPFWPIFGNTFYSTFQKRHAFEDVDQVYRAFPDERYVAYIDGIRTMLVIRDPEIIRNTTVKDFDHFVDHMQFFDADLDPLFGASLFALNGDRWRDMRATLSPAFTSAKMRHMIQFVTEISDNIIQHLEDHVSEEIDIDDLMRRYTNDVIASTSFGLQVNSLKDKDNEFFVTGQKILNFDFVQIMKLFFSYYVPAVSKGLNIKLYPQKIYRLFNGIIASTLRERKKNNIKRPDMIQLFMETPKEWTTEELTGQAFLFFAAGYETSASVLAMCLHELALNPDIQERLYQEISAFKETRGTFTSDNMPELVYLDCVVNETLRKWSPAIALDRKCVKTYELPPPRVGGKPYVLNPGDMIFNSVNSLHLDPQYFPDPLTFNPDRFSKENKHNIKPFTFMPFGSGPRICIGIRFALMEVKALVYHVILNFSIHKSPKTADPIQLINKGFLMKSKDGAFVRFEKRQTA